MQVLSPLSLNPALHLHLKVKGSYVALTSQVSHFDLSAASVPLVHALHVLPSVLNWPAGQGSHSKVSVF